MGTLVRELVPEADCTRAAPHEQVAFIMEDRLTVESSLNAA